MHAASGAFGSHLPVEVRTIAGLFLLATSCVLLLPGFAAGQTGQWNATWEIHVSEPGVESVDGLGTFSFIVNGNGQIAGEGSFQGTVSPNLSGCNIVSLNGPMTVGGSVQGSTANIELGSPAGTMTCSNNGQSFSSPVAFGIQCSVTLATGAACGQQLPSGVSGTSVITISFGPGIQTGNGNSPPDAGCPEGGLPPPALLNTCFFTLNPGQQVKICSSTGNCGYVTATGGKVIVTRSSIGDTVEAPIGGGLAQMTFGNNGYMDLDSGARAGLVAGGARIWTGNVHVKTNLPQGQHQYYFTPSETITDSGTEFVIGVDSSNMTTVSVISGSVTIEDDNSQQTISLPADQQVSLHYSTVGQTSRQMDGSVTTFNPSSAQSWWSPLDNGSQAAPVLSAPRLYVLFAVIALVFVTALGFALRGALTSPASKKPKSVGRQEAVATPATLYCKNCGSPIPTADSFCQSCGTKVSSPQAAYSTAGWGPPRNVWRRRGYLMTGVGVFLIVLLIPAELAASAPGASGTGSFQAIFGLVVLLGLALIIGGAASLAWSLRRK